jgi:hypothetical protein
MAQRRARWRGRAWLLPLLAVYALLLATNPLLHHDVACHVKSPTHCTSCNASPWASRIEAGVPLSAQPLPEAGRVVWETLAPARSSAQHELTGRSPPA